MVGPQGAHRKAHKRVPTFFDILRDNASAGHIVFDGGVVFIYGIALAGDVSVFGFPGGVSFPDDGFSNDSSSNDGSSSVGFLGVVVVVVVIVVVSPGADKHANSPSRSPEFVTSWTVADWVVFASMAERRSRTIKTNENSLFCKSRFVTFCPLLAPNSAILPSILATLSPLAL